MNKSLTPRCNMFIPPYLYSIIIDIKTMDKIKHLVQRDFDLKETLMVLKSPINIYWCWGVTNIYAVDNGGVILKVNGHHWKHYVLITLAYNDTYTVSLLDARYDVTKTINDVYFDMLQSIVDEEIESKGV